MIPYSRDTQPQRFGHMLILKLAHGLLSWLGGSETTVKGVRFAFARPDFSRITQSSFRVRSSLLHRKRASFFDPRQFGAQSPAVLPEATEFLERAPLDWIFTGSRAHTYSLRVRAFLYGAAWQSCQLPDAASTLKMTPRTLSRRLKEEETSFQDIKDALRRDIAIRALQHGTDSIEQIAFETGFSAPANFHRAFRNWTSRTPGSYRL